MNKLLPLLLALLALPLSACGDDKADAEPRSIRDVTLRVGVQKDGVRSILEASGALRGAPYRVDWSTFIYGPPLVEAASADRIDVAGVGSTPPIFGAAAADPSFRVIAVLRERDRWEDTLLVPARSPIRRIQDLKGKRIAVAKGSSAHGFLLNVLHRAAIEPSDVELSYLPPADGLAAFTTGRVDAWAVWEPFVSQAEQDARARTLAGGPPDEHGQQFEIASAKAIEDPARKAALSDFLGRLRRAFAWAARHPEAWARAWSKESKLPLTTTRSAARRKLLDVLPVDDQAVAQQQALADRLAADEVLPGRISFDEIVARDVYRSGR